MRPILPPSNAADVLALAVLVYGGIRGCRRGLSRELAGLVSWAVTLGLGLRFHGRFGAWLANHSRVTGPAAWALAFVLAAAGVFLAMGLLRLLLRRVMRLFVEEKAERPGGALAGALRGTLLAAAIFIAMNMVPSQYLNRKFGEESVTGRILLALLPEIGRRREALE
jgi:uncharacterized membrane protein required for colicin V production